MIGRRAAVITEMKHRSRRRTPSFDRQLGITGLRHYLACHLREESQGWLGDDLWWKGQKGRVVCVPVADG